MEEPVVFILTVGKFPEDGGVRFPLKCWYSCSELSGVRSGKTVMQFTFCWHFNIGLVLFVEHVGSCKLEVYLDSW